MNANFFCINCKTPVEAAFKACPFCGEPITDFLRKYLLDPIDGKYRILSRLGIGGMGEVYKVLHIHLNTIRVVKLMRSALKDSGAEMRFVREARLATRIHHPNVATLFDFSMLDDKTDYMVWEFIEGTNLAELLRTGGPVPPRECARLCIQALAGLEAIHRSGIVHRDISPENIMITEDDEGNERVKIIDLGIAKQLGDAADDQTKTGMFVGKWKYCSPEHFGFLESGTSIDARADIYSFGIVLYELLTGRPPFLAHSPQQYVMLHTGESPFSLGEVNPDLEGLDALEAVVFRSLEKRRSQRYQTAREFRVALEDVADSLPEKKSHPRVRIPALAPLAGTDSVTIASFAEEISLEVEALDASQIPSDRPGSGEHVSPDNTSVTIDSFPDRAVPPPFMKTLRDLPEPHDARSKEGASSASGNGKVEAGVDVPSQALLVPDSRPHRFPVKLGAAALVFLAVLATIVVFIRREPVGGPAVRAGVVEASAPGTLGINAFPWAEITRITDRESGKDMIAASLVTPAALNLPAGSYEIEARDPATKERVIQHVVLRNGESSVVMLQLNHSASPASLPSFIEAMQ